MIQLLRTILITLSLSGMIIPTSLAQDQDSTATEAEMLKLAQQKQSLENTLLKRTELIGLLQVKKENNPFRFGSLQFEKSR